MFNIGDNVSFFSLNEDFDDITNIDWFVENRNYYILKEFDGTNMVVNSSRESRDLKVENVFNEYQVFTPESLKQHLQSLNHKHKAVCLKIKQLYRKHNESGSSFKFQGV